MKPMTAYRLSVKARKASNFQPQLSAKNATEAERVTW